MANRDGHRRFGSVRKLPSGRFQVRYLGPDGRERTAPETFEKKTEADRYLSLVEVQMARKEWVDPERAKVKLGVYASEWIKQRPKLRPRTVHLYTWLLGKHVAPYLGEVPLGRLDTAMVREWRATADRVGRLGNDGCEGISTPSGCSHDRCTRGRNLAREPVPHPRR